MSSREGLYPRLLGDSWLRLDDVLRNFHGSDEPVRASGVFRVRHGTHPFARLLLQAARLPTAAESVDVILVIARCGDGEEWRRTFGRQPMVSTQAERRDGLLAERIGIVEVLLRTGEVDGALTLEAVGAALRLGRLRIALPSWLSPRLTAWERPGDERDEIRVSVDVSLPLVGDLLSYDGTLNGLDVHG